MPIALHISVVSWGPDHARRHPRMLVQLSIHKCSESQSLSSQHTDLMPCPNVQSPRPLKTRGRKGSHLRYDIDIAYILVVGHFGLATGWRENPEQHATSRVQNRCSRPADNGMVHSIPTGTAPIQLCTMIMTNPQESGQLDFVFYVLLFFVFSVLFCLCVHVAPAGAPA